MEIIKRGQEEWDIHFLRIAKECSTMSKDPSTKVGCTIVSPDKRIISCGFNGFPKGVPDYKEWYTDRNMKYKLIKHAEENALSFAKEIPKGSSVYVYPLYPCETCATMLRENGIIRIVTVKHKEICEVCTDICATKRWKKTVECIEYEFI